MDQVYLIEMRGRGRMRFFSQEAQSLSVRERKLMIVNLTTSLSSGYGALSSMSISILKHSTTKRRQKSH